MSDYYFNESEAREDVQTLYETGAFPERLGNTLMALVEGVAHHRRFINYTSDWKDEMKGNAIAALMKTLTDKRYDFTRPNTKFFSWATRVVFNQFYNTLKKKRNELKKSMKYRKDSTCECM